MSWNLTTTSTKSEAMSSNPPDLQDYYSPQVLASRLFHLDLQVENLKAIVRMQMEHLSKIDVGLLDLQHQIRTCVTKHEGDKGG